MSTPTTRRWASSSLAPPKTAEQENIDGICVDYETAPVWCFCDRCLKRFGEESGRPVKDRAEVAPGGPRADEYRDFGRRMNRRLLEKVKAIMLEKNPKLQYACLASAADLPMYWYDGRVRARHAAEELVKFADAIYASHYCYEVPGGMAAVIRSSGPSGSLPWTPGGASSPA